MTAQQKGLILALLVAVAMRPVLALAGTQLATPIEATPLLSLAEPAPTLPRFGLSREQFRFLPAPDYVVIGGRPSIEVILPSGRIRAPEKANLNGEGGLRRAATGEGKRRG
ncbi:MAG: hypothetical protein HYY12_04795 [Candidatus Methylomirabilis oxyfera]|nr:hypothetical protein [Candidatus Methylomirabilis oxyfera]